MRAWLTVSAEHAHDPQVPTAANIFNSLVDPSGPGACTECHSVDQVNGALVVNWRGKQSNPNARYATVFLHKPHLALFTNSGCETCHVASENVDAAGNYRGWDPTKFVAGFQPIKREVCNSCHVPLRAGDACITCHNYHVGEIPIAKSAISNEE